MKTFPKGFLWGAATSSHQVEGGLHNSWTVWEQANADRLAAEAEGKLSHLLPRWDELKAEATNPANYRSGVATDHWNRYEADFDLAKSLGHNAYRLSIEWSRIEPSEGQFDQAALEHYLAMIKALRQRGIEPLVTLWHWTLPVWLAERGGWLNPQTIGWFERFTEQVVTALGSEVKFWITLNEIEVYTGHGYVDGEWPPAQRRPLSAIKVVHNLLAAHRRAYKLIHLLQPAAHVGIAKNNIDHEAADLISRPVARLADYFWNFYVLDRIRSYQDFIGLNFYFHNRVYRGRLAKNLNRRQSDIGWELKPESIKRVLLSLKRYGQPIYITENGLADAKDRDRAWFIQETIKAIAQAIEQGVDVRGYLHWSLLDNFEWSGGFAPRFGLIEVDYKTLERRVRPSARVYAALIKDLTQN